MQSSRALFLRSSRECSSFKYIVVKSSKGRLANEEIERSVGTRLKKEENLKKAGTVVEWDGKRIHLDTGVC